MSVIFTTKCVDNNQINGGSLASFGAVSGSFFNTSPVINQGGFTVSSTAITVPETGYYCLMLSLYISANGPTRVAPAVKWRIGTVSDIAESGPTYIRDATQRYSSIQFTTFAEISSGTSLTLHWARYGNTGTCSLDGSQSLVSIWKVD
jgi:hypothetical protein